MSKESNLAIIHLRDFIEEVGPAPTRPDKTPTFQIQTTLNVPSIKPEEQSDDFDICPIPALVRFFTPASQLHLYQQDVFIYAWGPFHVSDRRHDQPTIMVNAYAVDW